MLRRFFLNNCLLGVLCYPRSNRHIAPIIGAGGEVQWNSKNERRTAGQSYGEVDVATDRGCYGRKLL